MIKIVEPEPSYKSKRIVSFETPIFESNNKTKRKSSRVSSIFRKYSFNYICEYPKEKLDEINQTNNSFSSNIISQSPENSIKLDAVNKSYTHNPTDIRWTEALVLYDRLKRMDIPDDKSTQIKSSKKLNQVDRIRKEINKLRKKRGSLYPIISKYQNIKISKNLLF